MRQNRAARGGHSETLRLGATRRYKGRLGPFTIVSNVTLATARVYHTSAVIGNSLYIVGGNGGRFLNSVERATINADGSLSTFTTVPGVALVTARYQHTSAIVE